MGILTGKRALIIGLASKRSIAYGIATAMKREGAELAFSYQNEQLKARVMQLSADVFDNASCFACDAAKDEDISALFEQLNTQWDQFDILVHSIAYAPRDQLAGEYVDCTTREGFRISHEISSYSFTALAKAAKPMMIGKLGSLITLTYLGSTHAVPNYNVMGLAKASLEANVRYMAQSLGPHQLRVNAISAGPIRTLAASGIKDLSRMLNAHEKTAPLRTLTTINQVGNVAAFLGSDLSSGITGEVIHVDGGVHAVSTVGLGEQ